MVLGEHHESEVRLSAVFKGDRPISEMFARERSILNRTQLRATEGMVRTALGTSL